MCHFQTVTENRKRGAKRAAAMQKAQQQLTETGNCEGRNDDNGTINDDNEEYCGVCGILYEEETDEIENGLAVMFVECGIIGSVQVSWRNESLMCY